MDRKIDWKNVCEDTANILVEDVCRKFANNEEIRLNMCRPISVGPVYGRLDEKYLNDEYNTVIITWSIIERKDIVLDKSHLYQIATDEMNGILKHPDWQNIKDPDEFRNMLREHAEWAVGIELQNIFSETACANPDKFKKYETHGHAVRRITQEDLEKNPPKSIRNPRLEALFEIHNDE